MTLRDLFGAKSHKLVSDTTIEELGNETESEEYVKSNIVDKNRFVPEVDFSDPNNFARFGSATKYYEEAISRIQRTYPYDGSLNEKLDWHNKSNDFHNYFFENEYPRTNGYINIGQEYGSITTNANEYDSTSKNEYIFFKGGPNPADNAVTKTLKTIFKEANIYEVDKNRTSNLEIDGNKGNTVEFWLKKNNELGSRKQVIFDLWNSASYGASNYGRFRVAITGSQFQIEYASGSDGVSSVNVGQNLNIFNAAWHFYSLSLINSGSNISIKLYESGSLNDEVLTGTNIGLVSGSMLGNIGSLISPVGASGVKGDGKLSGSLDEFRFWKTKRSDKKISRYWFRQVGGGTNTDDANTDLGIYFKFNEGIVSPSSIHPDDTKVLDYSGRVSNGTWTGYSITSRSTGSAIVESDAATFEFRDPIISSNHSDVLSLKDSLTQTGNLHDEENSALMYNSFPSWMSEEDEVSGEPLKELVQIAGEFFDDMYLKIEALPKIKESVYRSGKPLPFASRLLESVGFTAPEIFTKASIYEEILSVDNEREFEEKLYNIKNHIYQNIYNNLIYIYRSKGTEKSIRNLIRCFGVDDELIKINMYADGVDYKLEDSYNYTNVKKNYVNFNDVDRFDSNVYQMKDASNPSSVSFLTGNINQSLVGSTIECEAIFPKKFDKSNPLFFRTDFVSSSLIGVHSALEDPDDTTFPPLDCSYSVFAVRPEEESKDAYFLLSSSHFNVNMTSSVFRDVYDNEKWNIGVKLRRKKYPFSPGVFGSEDYIIEFYGVNTVLDTIQNEFTLTESLGHSVSEQYFSNNKRIYVGAHRINMTGSVITGPGINNEQFSDAKISGVRYWLSDIGNDIIKEHAKDPTNFGPESPYSNIKTFATPGLSASMVPQMETLALHWDFDTVTGSDNGSGAPPSNQSDASFLVEDISSGSLLLADRWKFIGDVSRVQHTGYGGSFPRNSANVVQKEYVFAARKRLPETINSSDLVEIRDADDENFTKESRPVNHYFAIEKSMYQSLSEEMIKFFGTITDFNNLIGDPVNRYRQRYNDLDKLRSLFFERLDNAPDLERFVDFYKWIDDAITHMVFQLIPASVNFSKELSTMVESHVLERNKYWNKLPTIELKQDIPITSAESIGRLKYNWKTGHAPVSLDENNNCLWWLERAERDNKTGNDLNSEREKIFNTTLNALNRRFTQIYNMEADGAVMDARTKNTSITKQLTRFGTDNYLKISADDITSIKCEDE